MSVPLQWRLDGDSAWVQVSGRARFDVAHALRDRASVWRRLAVKTLYVDLGPCLAMDSTFMGVLAMLGTLEGGPTIRAVAW